MALNDARLRRLLEEAAGAEALSPRELARLEGRITAGAGAALLTPRLVALAAAAAVCVAWIVTHRPASDAAAPLPAETLALGGPGEATGLHQLELDALLKAMPGEGTALEPVLVADFERVEDLAGVTVVGNGMPQLSQKSRSGRRSLRCEAGSEEAPAEVLVAAPAALRTREAHAVSAWLLALGTPADVALGDLPGARRVEPGEWRWVTFDLPDPAPGQPAPPLAELRFRLTGTGKVLLDRVEAWCARRSNAR